MLRKDGNRHRLLIYIKRELIINRFCDFDCKHIESMTFIMQQKRRTKKIIVIASYRPSCLSKSLDSRSWDLLLRTRDRYDNIMAVGDLNCDLSVPEKHDKQERALLRTRITTSSF